MKLSKREAVLLTILALVVIFFIEYQLIYIPGMEKYNNLVAEDQQIQKQVDEINRLIKNIPSIRANKEKTLAEIYGISEPFYDQLNTDALMWNTHDLLTKNGLVPESYSISEVRAAVVSIDQKKLSDLNYKLKALVNDYAAVPKTMNDPTPTPTSAPGTDQEKASTVSSNSNKTDELEVYSLLIDFSGNYDQLRQFIANIESLKKTIIVSTLTMNSTDNDGVIDASIMINYFGVKKINTKLDSTNVWAQVPYIAGTGNPFSIEIPLPSPSPMPLTKMTVIR